MQIQKIISGGQTGVDRAALDVAINRGIPHGGWCPKGRKSEDGTIPEIYVLQETDTSAYEERTEKNVRGSDGTLIISLFHQLDKGTRWTRTCCEKYHKPFLIIDLSREGEKNSESLIAWISIHQISVLHIAGSRESNSPGIYGETKQFLCAWLRELQS